MDFANLKSLTIPEGEVKEIYSDDVLLWKGGYTNIIDTVGYTDGVRLNSSGATTNISGFTTTGMIDISAYDDPTTIQTKGVNFNYSGYCYFMIFNESGTKLGYTTIPSIAGKTWNGFTCSVDDEGNVTITTVSGSANHFRITGYGSGANLIVTINEEIT